MSSQRPKVNDNSQQSLFSFFKKPGVSTPTASNGKVRLAALDPNHNGHKGSLPTPPFSNAKKAAAVSPPAIAKPGALDKTPAVVRNGGKADKVISPTSHYGQSSITPPITSEGDVPQKEVSSSVTSSSQPLMVPLKRNSVEEDSDEEEDDIVSFKRRFGKARAPILGIHLGDDEVCLDEESTVLPNGKKDTRISPLVESSRSKRGSLGSKPKPKYKDDDDDFSSGEESEDYFDDDLDDFIVEDDEEVLPEAKQKAKPKVKPKSPENVSSTSYSNSSRPPMVHTQSGSGSGISQIKTQAELAKMKAKEQRDSNEKVFDFLLDPKDADGVRPGEEGYDPRTLYIPKKAWLQFTPFETQFWEIKQNHYDTVLFFQKGKFFELYEEDASIGHSQFDLKLTDRVKMKMVGVPESSFDFWAAKFLAQGYKVGRVDQCETALGAEMRLKDDKAAKSKAALAKSTAPNGKAIVRRELRSVLTSGTIVDGSMLTEDLASHCVAIKEEIPDSSSAPRFGVCALDASTAEFSLSTFVDDISRTQLETLIRQLKPKEIIHEKGNLSISSLRVLRNSLSIDCQWTALKAGTEFLRPEDTKDELRKLFQSTMNTQAMDVVEEQVDEDANIPENIRIMYSNPVAMCALGGMIWYLRQLNLDSDLVTARNFNIYDPLSKGKALVLDGQTLAHIEVLQNSQGRIEGTLLQLLSRCTTPFGKRLFKIWLCAPLKEVAAINDRLDAVDDLLGNTRFSTQFDSTCKKLPDLERLLSRIHSRNCKKTEFLGVLAAFVSISKLLISLSELAAEFQSEGIRNMLRRAPDISTSLDAIGEMFESEDLLPVNGRDEAFEIVRANVENLEEDLEEHLELCKKQLKCKTLSFKDIGTKDIYQIQVPVGTKVPSAWTKMSSTKEFNRYYSPEVTRLVQELKEARERRMTVVNEFQYRLYGEFDKDYSIYLETVKIVAELDCLISLSKSSAALGEPFTRPEIVESDTAILEFEDLRHPCLLSSATDFIPNDVKLGGNAEEMILLTGPNMAGKSTLLRMTCAAVIMSQLGCYVPATKARIAPVDAIYSRMGANDFIFANASTFKVEMDDCNKILTKATPRSLVILDELGRGTSTYDGMAIAFAVLHRLATHVGCVGFFATHFTSLTEDFAYHPQVRLCNMQTQVDDETRAVVFLYKLINGSSPKSYGPHVASMAGLPDLLVKRAIGISKQFETTSRSREVAMRANESLPLTSQADAAFLVRLAKLGISENMDKGQLLRTLEIIRRAVRNIKDGN